MRKPIICGNWKMNKTRDEALQFIFAISQSLPDKKLVDIVICPPSIILRDLVKRQGDDIRIGAQNMHYANFGAYTGEISSEMLVTSGVEYVILGHSERRAYFNETNSSVNMKVHAALSNGLKPIVCVGESLEQRHNHETYDFIKEQIIAGFEGIDESDFSNVCIAYEPIWAIGTGLSASLDRTHKAISFIRKTVIEEFGPEAGNIVRILYGGSVNSDSASDLKDEADLDGLLIGGASLIPEVFVSICNIWAKKR